MFHAEYITVEVTGRGAKNTLSQGRGVRLDEIRFFAKEEIAGLSLPLRQPFPECC